MLNDDAVGVIDVPNGYRAIRDQWFYEFFPGPVNNFSVKSLVSLATQAGFNVIACHESFGGNYLELWVRNVVNIENGINNIKLDRQEIIQTLKNYIHKNVDEGKVTAIYGCGAKTLTIFAAGLADASESICVIIDSDPNKQGRFVPNTGIKVVSPDEAIAKRPESIVILALSYRDEIVKVINKKYSSCHEILTINDFGELVYL